MTPKTTDRWTMQVALEGETVQTGQWESIRWRVGSLLPHDDPMPNHTALTLELHRDQRTAYRFNLNAAQPHLFLLCHEDETDSSIRPMHLTASQDEAASYMDGEHLMLSIAMPAAVQCWIDAYLGVHGELVEEGRKKKRNGRGRSSGQ